MTKLSILISSHNRIALLRRGLWAIACRPPSVPYEVIVADDGSTDDIEGLLRKFSSCFSWKLVKVSMPVFEQETGIRPFFNNPALTNNVAFRHSVGELVALMGNEIIPWENCIEQLLDHDISMNLASVSPWLAFTTTYDLHQNIVERLDTYGQNLSQAMVEQSLSRPLQSPQYRSDVTNYLSVCPRQLWEAIGGYDERYVGGISSDDSDFVRRARAFGCTTSVLEAVSLHQYHAGKTCYYNPPPSTISDQDWERGVATNHAIYHAWDGTHGNPQGFPWGNLGVSEVVTNVRPAVVAMASSHRP